MNIYIYIYMYIYYKVGADRARQVVCLKELIRALSLAIWAVSRS